MQRPFVIFLSPLFALSMFARAQTADNTLGWKKSAKASSNISFSSSQDVVGQTDGTSETYGASLKAEFQRNGNNDEWRNEGSLLATTTRTPGLPRFVKSSDELKLSTMYLHFWNGNRNFGPYARLEGAAPMFKGEDVQSTPKTYRVTARDQSSTAVTATSYRLTDGFKPLTTKESLGVFWKAVNDEKLKVELRVGAAAMQIAAGGQYTVKGGNPAGEIVVQELDDVSQAGLEAALAVKGKVDEKSAYELGVETLTPFVNDKPEGDDRDALRLTNVDALVKLTSKFTEWASFGYDYKLKLQPQLVDRAQQIHMIVLNFNYNVF